MREYLVVLGTHVAWTGVVALFGWYYIGNAMLTMWVQVISLVALSLAVMMYVAKEETN